jgi:hypothetical protein
MSFLAPWALLLAGAAAVPLVLHLLRRRTGTRVEFPAVRYLLRAEKEHAREVRMRNIVLMLLRVTIVLAIAFAMARPIGLLPGIGHPPTAVVVLLDNSLSSGAAGSAGPVLTKLVDGARAVLDASASGDAITLVTMDGEAIAGTPAALHKSLDALRPLDGAGDPRAALRRARALLEASAQPERRLVVLTDGQATTWRDIDSAAVLGDGIRTVVLQPPGTPPANRAITGMVLEPPHWSPRGVMRGTVLGASAGDSASWRLTLNGESLARGTAGPGAPIVARVQPSMRGWVSGILELEPDELRGDDARHFAVHVGEAPALQVDATSGAFLRGAVATLVEGGRARNGTEIFVGSAERARVPGLIFAPNDPLRIADANRALARAGVPWRFGARRTGESQLRGARFPEVGVKVWYDLVPASGAVADTLVRVGAQPWAVAGPNYVVLASPAEAEATDLPVRAGFVPWLDALLAERLSSAGGSVTEVVPGAVVTVPFGVTAIEAPDGSTRPVTPGSSLRAAQRAGVYFWRRTNQRAGALVVNAEPDESLLTPLATDSLRVHLRAAEMPDTPDATVRATFAANGRRALDTSLLILAALLLLAESILARRGRGASVTP